MTDFLERFKHLEIPQEVRNVDWGFLEAPLSLPALPLADDALLFVTGGRAFSAVDRAPADGGDRVIFYADWHALEPIESLASVEAAWRARNAAALARVEKSFWDTVPAAVVRDPTLIERARAVLSPPREQAAASTAPASTLARLLGDTRLCRIEDKLYDLVPLKDYVRVFEKAIDPPLLRRLLDVPDTVTPEELLAIVEASLDAVHAKARSPLRNKMLTCRAVIGGVTHLPLYREPSAAMFDAYRLLLEREIKTSVLAARGRGE